MSSICSPGIIWFKFRYSRCDPRREAKLKRDLKWIEIFLILGMMGVAFFHASELCLSESGGLGWWTIAVSTSTRFIVSGFLIRRVYTSASREFDFKHFWKDNFLSIASLGT
ncbi:MAG: hypothetical protein SWK76_06905 [Actinomycetota bacterium]|nr:hypothetical protein [Actinomycetota bacterium]